MKFNQKTVVFLLIVLLIICSLYYNKLSLNKTNKNYLLFFTKPGDIDSMWKISSCSIVNTLSEFSSEYLQ